MFYLTKLRPSHTPALTSSLLLKLLSAAAVDASPTDGQGLSSDRLKDTLVSNLDLLGRLLHKGGQLQVTGGLEHRRRGSTTSRTNAGTIHGHGPFHRGLTRVLQLNLLWPTHQSLLVSLHVPLSSASDPLLEGHLGLVVQQTGGFGDVGTGSVHITRLLGPNLPTKRE